MIILDSIRSSSKESRSHSRQWNFTITADGDIERDKKEAERRGFRKVISIIDYARARDSIREITNLIDAGLIHVPPTEVLPLEDAARAHQMIDTGHVRGNWYSRSPSLR